MGKSVEYYLSKGYDRKMAEYFASGRERITKVVPRNDFTLLLSFDNGETRLYDAGPLLQAGTVFAPASSASAGIWRSTPAPTRPPS